MRKDNKEIEKQKRCYSKPLLETIALDSKISLNMESEEPPPDDPVYFKQDYFNLNPFKLPNLK